VESGGFGNHSVDVTQTYPAALDRFALVAQFHGRWYIVMNKDFKVSILLKIAGLSSGFLFNDTRLVLSNDTKKICSNYLIFFLQPATILL
jgi:hypothetical protein